MLILQRHIPNKAKINFSGNGIVEVLAMYLYEKPYDQDDVDLLFGFFDCWLTSIGGNGYNDSYDYVNDGKIDMKDWAVLANHSWNLPDLPSYETRFYYLTDALGSVRGLIGGRLNQESDREFYNYDVYGTPSESSVADNPFMFAGYWYDSETGNCHLENRTYNPPTGRFLQIDPKGINPSGGKQNLFKPTDQYIDGVNLYEYVRSNPIKYIDPWGLDSITYWSPGGFSFPVPSQKISINLDNLQQPAPKADFWICRRQMQCFPYLSYHDYISYGENPWGGKDETKGGWGFSREGLTGEKHFNPTHCRSCSIAKTGKLSYGLGAEKTCETATKEDVISCVESYPPRKDYAAFTYNCINYAKEATKSCCLNCSNQWTKKK